MNADAQDLYSRAFAAVSDLDIYLSDIFRARTCDICREARDEVVLVAEGSGALVDVCRGCQHEMELLRAEIVAEHLPFKADDEGAA